MTGTTRDAKRARTAQRILQAAREQFASRGFDGTTIRGIAAAAEVDASLVLQHYGSKAALFALAVQLPDDDDQAAPEHLLDVLGVRLGELPPETRALVRSMLTSFMAAAASGTVSMERTSGSRTSPGRSTARTRACAPWSS
jgi:AcrR family transcriptional regulator